MFWNGRTAIDGLSGSGKRRLGRSASAALSRPDPIRADRARDIFEVLLAQIGEGEVEPAGRVLLNPSGYANPARLGQSLEPRRDIDPVAENVAILDDDVALMDADAQLDAAGPLGHRRLGPAISRWTSTAQRSASTTLANSTRNPSPVVLTSRPRCAAIVGSITSARIDLSRSSVPSSSAPISRE